jgi:hypothetical protein
MNASLKIYHPTPMMNGSALRLGIRPAVDDIDGRMFATIAEQKFSESGNQVFNFDDGITVGFDFFDLCEILKVFRGFDESLCYGKGLFHRTSDAAFRINLMHRIEIDCGYEFEVTRKDRADASERTIRIKLTNTEALGICTAIEHSLTMIAFGVPKIS